MTNQLLGSAAPPGEVTSSAASATSDRDGLARIDTSWTMSSLAIVSVYGEIDMTNSPSLTEYALAIPASHHGLILDLTQLKFFGATGFSALHRISVGCAQAGVDWALVPGAAVSLLLRVCDPDGLLPAVDTVVAALARLQGS